MTITAVAAPPRQGVLLVGGSSGIGLAIAESVVRAGPASIVLAGRPGPALDAAAARLRDQGHRVTVLTYYAGWTTQQAARLMQVAERAAGRLDHVIVAVGRLSTRDGDETTEPGLAQLLQTNLTGPALVANEAAGLLTRRGHGTLVVVTSAVAVRPRDQILGYAVAKQALDSLVRGLDRRTRPHGVRCLVVRPGQVRTRMTEGLPHAPLTTGPDHVGARLRRRLGHRSGVVWSPAPMGVVTTLLRATPAWALPRGLR